MLGEEKLEEKVIRHEYLETRIKIRKNKFSILTDEGHLCYDQEKLEEDLPRYLSEQSLAHRNYLRNLSSEPGEAFMDLQVLNRRKMILETNALGYKTWCWALFQILVKPYCWLKGSNWTKFLKEKSISPAKEKLNNYRLMKHLIQDGRDFLKQNLEKKRLSAESKENMWQCLEIIDDISGMYDKLILVSKRRLFLQEQWFYTLFPQERERLYPPIPPQL